MSVWDLNLVGLLTCKSWLESQSSFLSQTRAGRVFHLLLNLWERPCLIGIDSGLCKLQVRAPWVRDIWNVEYSVEIYTGKSDLLFSVLNILKVFLLQPASTPPITAVTLTDGHIWPFCLSSSDLQGQQMLELSSNVSRLWRFEPYLIKS